ncbi:MAG: tetratricopeptide repeat protein [Nitrospina sp.]|nr:tetratricopeptide repeat protein [Nitrospina sp.]MBT5631306.1 tetratricopeptide repeat protein [Nitrospina sp.]
MISCLRLCTFLSFWKGHTIIYSVAKGLFVLLVLTGILAAQVKETLAIDFKTYLQGAKAEILRHKKIIQEDPLDAVAYFDLGMAYLALGRHEDEVDAYQEAIKLNPKYAVAHYNLSKAYDLLKDGPNAIKHMLRAQELYSQKRNHTQMRKVQRQLKFLNLKYQGLSSSISMDHQN